jgi:septal ring factor EnvC (AmiA/AmiB activator)
MGGMSRFSAAVSKKNITAVVVILLMFLSATGYAEVRKKKTDPSTPSKTGAETSSKASGKGGRKDVKHKENKAVTQKKAGSKTPTPKKAVTKVANQKKIAEKKREIEKIDSKIQEHREEIQRFSEKESEIMGTLNTIDQKVNASQQKLNTTKKKIVLLEAELKTNYNDLNKTKAAIEDNKAAITRRLVSTYKMNRIGRMNVMASADSVFGFMKRQKAMEFILKSDQQLLNDYMKNLSYKTDLQARLDEKKKETESLAGDYKKEITQFEQNRTRRKLFLGEIRQKKNLSVVAIESLKDSAEALNRTVMNLTREMDQAAALKAKAPEVRTPKPKAEFSSIPEKEDNTSPFVARKGQLALPVKGRVVGFFGFSTKNEFKAAMFNSGIQVEADRGEPIQSVGPGQVLFAEWLKGYGNMVIIDHGNSYYSLYCHAEEVFKKKGDTVEDREVIATVGDTGSLTGPGLHFEIRHKGTPVDPLKWFRKGKG